MEEKRFLRSGIFHSMLKDEESKGFPIIGMATKYLFGERKYFHRCLTQFQNGKDDFKRKFIDARTVLFNREEVSNWLYKTKEEAETETDLVFIKYEASTMEEIEIDFERVGYLAGIYFEAKRFLKIIIAIESVDKEKPHYSIIDQLNELDQIIIAKDIIPGYYRVQKDSRINSHEYELKNLDDEWGEYLSYKNNHEVGPSFGNIAYQLDNYHTEFELKLARIKPLSKIKELLNYHLKGLKIGQEIDFLNHIQYRILPGLVAFVGSNYIMYKQIIGEWLKEKHFGLSQEDEVFLVKSVHIAITTFLDDINENRKRNDENKYNTVTRGAFKQY